MDPHADYRVDPYSYLVISELGEYSISGELQQIPLGFHVKQFRKFPGLRQFKVSRSGDDSYDIVFVGTMMIQNGFAYISGQTLFCEEPYGYLKRIRFPPFAFKVPDYFGERTTESIIPKLVKEHQEKLMKIIKEELEDITLDGVFDFDIAKRHEFYPPHPTCTTCRARLMVYEDGLCPICDSERRKAHRAVHEIEETGTANTTSTSELVAARDEEGKPVSIVAIMIDKLEKSMKEKAVHEKIDSANTLSTSESDPARAAKGKALMKVGSTTEEVEKSIKGKAAHLAEQLVTSLAKMEAELRKLKVQSDELRNAAGMPAASMLLVGNDGDMVERSLSLGDDYYSPSMRMTLVALGERSKSFGNNYNTLKKAKKNRMTLASLIDNDILNEKEMEYKDILEANKALELEIEASKSALEAARAKERETLTSVTQQLQAAQAAYLEKKAELRKVRELIASVRKRTAAYADDLDDDILKKKKRRE